MTEIAAAVTAGILKTWIVREVSHQYDHLASEELNRLREDNWDQEQVLSSSSEKSWQMDSRVQKTPPPVPPKPKNYLYSRKSPWSRPPPFKPPAPTRGCSLSKLLLPHVSYNPKFASLSDLSSVVQNELSLEH
ncbi:uncharacterized protein LOC143227279 isoform X2 [Tachypleus tridentatus]|uniref:uncharacterized protein LOC143227279 isoform X2 n=1 Tax=Tachypleus tridentatus TaxID=6853 RepID=UPI003FD22C05